MGHWLVRCAVAALALNAPAAFAIEVQPAAEQVRAALEAGKAMARQGGPPDSFYVRFGAGDDLHPGGFLITKLGALSVMATHMALRGLQPGEADVAQVIEAKTMLISTVVFGNLPNFAVDSSMVLDQGGRTVKPVTVRFDGQANRRSPPQPPDRPPTRSQSPEPGLVPTTGGNSPRNVQSGTR